MLLSATFCRSYLFIVVSISRRTSSDTALAACPSAYTLSGVLKSNTGWKSSPSMYSAGSMPQRVIMEYATLAVNASRKTADMFNSS